MLTSVKSMLGRSDLFAFNLRNRDAWVAAQASTIPPGTRVLDAGAGSAPYRALFAHCRYETQDFTQLDDAQLRHGSYGRIDHVCDMTAIPVPDATFGAVLCTEVIEHHPEPIRVIAELARVLVPGGRLLLTAPLGSGIHQEPYHFYGGYTPYWYERFLPQAGLTNITIEANAGSLRHIGQETIRFVRMTRPFTQKMGLIRELIWLPVWVVLAPILGLIVPVAARAMDRFDTRQHFTVGYHVSAERAQTA
jgi:ubiquinone/menaquinone biosynthesis C-methylase UbiE